MKIIIKENYDDLSLEAAGIVARLVKEKPDSLIGLIAGSTPLGLYKELVKLSKRGAADFSRAVFFGLDEYYGFEMNQGALYEKDISFERFLKEELLNHIGSDRKNLVMPKVVNGDAVGSCIAYEKQIQDRGGIDLQLAGIGQNGHIGFNEPGSSFDSRTRIVQLDELTIKTNFEKFGKKAGLAPDDMPKYAVTAGIGTILESKHILLIASAQEKAGIIKEALKGPLSSHLPASALQLASDKLTVILDKQSASGM